MASSYRYKFVENSTNAGLTKTNFPVTNDGDNKQNKLIKRVLVAADFGGGDGQVDNAAGLILDVIPPSYNVLWFDVSAFRPAEVGNITQYNDLTNQLGSITVAEDFDASFHSIETVFWLEEDNTLRFFDKGHAQDDAKLEAGDLIITRLTIGQPQDTRDIMNP